VIKSATQTWLRRPRVVSLVCLTLVLALGSTGCSRTKPRKHWWQVWRPKSTETSEIYHPDTVFIPPPPEVVDPNAPGDAERLPPGSELPPPPVIGTEMAEPEAVRQPPAGMVSELRTVYFQHNSAVLGGSAKAVLDENARWLLDHPGYEVQIEGHCDSRGTNEYNLNLGDRRAKSVKAYLVAKGADSEQLHTISYGEERPALPDDGDVAWSKNRRVQFLVY